MNILAGWGKVSVAESQLQGYLGHWAGAGAQVGLLPGSFGDSSPDAMSRLAANWPRGWTAFVGTAGLHSRTLHLTSGKETGGQMMHQ